MNFPPCIYSTEPKIGRGFINMCVAVPSKIITIDNQMATIDVQGAMRKVSLMLLPEEAEVGEYVLVHAGFAIQKLDPEAGEETLKLFELMADLKEKQNS